MIVLESVLRQLSPHRGGKMDEGAMILLEALKKPLDKWMGPAVAAAWTTLKPYATDVDVTENPAAQQLIADKLDLKAKEEVRPKLPAMLADDDKQLWLKGEEVFHRDGDRTTCHGADGMGTIPNIYPPLVGSEWVTGSEERLTKLTLHGLWGLDRGSRKEIRPRSGGSANDRLWPDVE